MSDPDSSVIKTIKAFLVSNGLPDTYKDNYFKRRLNVRIRKTETKNFDQYLVFLKSNPNEIEALRKDLSINVTKFFRDTKAFDYFAELLTKLLRDHYRTNKKQLFKIWSAGCAIGAEPYSIAILVDEAINKYNLRGLTVKISATDFNEELLSIARRGVYDEIVLEDTPKHILQTYFEPLKNYSNDERNKQYRISYNAKKYVDFSHLDLTKSRYPFSNLDVITCRNVLIYFSSQAQFSVFRQFYDALKTNGHLFIGQSESMHLSYRGNFITVSPKHRVYSKIDESSLVPEKDLLKCDECDFTFARLLDLRVHQKKHLKEKKKLQKAKEFKYKGKLIECPYCPKSFITDSRFRAHLKFFHTKN